MKLRHTLVLLPEVPAKVGTGGQVRSYHFLRAALQCSELTVVLLADGTIPEELSCKIKEVVQYRQKSKASTGWKRLVPLLCPSKQFGRELIMTGRNICWDRMEDRRSLRHFVFGWLLYLYAAILGRCVCVFPYDIHVRIFDYEHFVESLSAVADVDYIWCEHAYLYPLAEHLSKKFDSSIVVDCHNVESVLKRSVSRMATSFLARSWYRLEASLVLSWERRMIRRSRLLFTCSVNDDHILRELHCAGATRVVIPNGVDTDYFSPSGCGNNIPTVLFSGTAGYAPNDDATAWLCQQIMPLVWQEVPQCRVILAGRSAAHKWGQWSNADSRIEVRSDVPDMRPYFSDAWLVVAPIRMGSGTRLKILEAMSFERAVVSTAIGAEGLCHVKNGTHFLLANDTEAFASSVVRLIKDPGKRGLLANSGRCAMLQNYQWNDLVSRATTAVKQVYGEERP